MDNGTSWQKKVTLLVNSCDAYADLWLPFFTLLKKYFAPLEMRVLLNTETKDFHMDGLTIEPVHSQAKTYGGRMRDALAQVDTEYVLLMLDDFFLRQPVRQDRLQDIITWMDQDPAIVYFNCDATESVKDLEVGKYPGYKRLPAGTRFTLNLQAAVWRTQRLRDYWRWDVSPWEWEERCNVMTAREKQDKFYCVTDPAARFMDYGYKPGVWMGVCYGKWVERDVVPLFEKEHIQVDFSKRGFCDPNYRPTSLNEDTQRSVRYQRIVACLGRQYLLPYFFFCRRCNLYSKLHHCAVDEDYFHYLQRKADQQNRTGKKCLLGPMQR